MKVGACSCGGAFRGLLTAVLLLSGSALAQDYSSMGITALVQEADFMLRQGKFSDAIPALEEVIKRMAEMDTPQGRLTLQTSRFQLARAYYQVGKTDKGMELLTAYLEQEPRSEERLALRMMAQGHLEKEDWDKVIEYVSRLLEMRGLDDDDILNGKLLLGQAYFRQELWAECVEPLTFVTRRTKDDKTRKLCEIMTVRALVESQQWGQLFGLVRRLYRTDAKYDITLNITLMQAGKALFEGAEEKDAEEGMDDLLNALFLYRMVLPREALIGHSNERVNELTAELEKKIRIGITETDQAGLQEEIDAIRESVQTLEELPPYEDEVTFRIGQIYAEVKRYWEAYVLFNSLYERDRKSEIGEASVLQSVLVLYDMAQTERAEERILRYLDEQPDGVYVRTLISMMMRDNLQKQIPQKVISLRPYVDALTATTDENERLVEAELHYLLAFAYLQARDYKQSAEQFDLIVTDYPDSPPSEDAVYFRGLAKMFQADYSAAYDDYKLYQEKGEHGEHYAASIFREGVCLFGMEEIAESEAVMTKFVENFPDSELASEAYSMRGDIEAAKDGSDNPDTPDIDEYDPHTLDRALADYRKAIEIHSVPSQAAYAVFQAANVYKLEFKWQEIIDLMNYYLNLLGEEADIAQTVYWIGQSQLELGQVNEAIESYLDAIERFGNDPAQEGVDNILQGLVNIAIQYLSDDDRDDLILKISLKLNDIKDDAEVLRLRLRVAQAYMEGPEAAAALGARLLAEDQQLSTTSPASLALMCDAAVAASDSEMMGKLYSYFKENFEDSDDIWHAYRARTVQLMGEENYGAALKAIDEIQGLFGPVPHMGWAQLAKGDCLFRMDEFEEAENAYNAVMGVPEWRGPIFAKAYLGMARCRIGRSDYETAHSFYQRTYLLFKSYDDGTWAADGYLGAAECLARLGRDEDALNTLNEMLEDTYVNTLPQADEARELKKKYGGA